MSYHILFSPTKNLRIDFAKQFQVFSNPAFLEEAQLIHKTLCSKGKMSLKDIMKISDKILLEVQTRLSEWEDATPIPAIYTYDGEAFRGLSAESLTPEAITFAQERLVILSGMYGILRPLDGIKPYRLEMQSKLKVGNHSNLYQFWNHKLASNLREKSTQLLNLASEEYSKVVLPYWDKNRVITPVFMEWNEGNPKMVMMYAKQARGRLLHYLLIHQVENLMELKKYQQDGYLFSSALSTELRWVFLR